MLTCLYVLIMSRMRFRKNSHYVVAWISRNSLLKTDAISKVYVTAPGLDPANNYFVNKHATI